MAAINSLKRFISLNLTQLFYCCICL